MPVPCTWVGRTFPNQHGTADEGYPTDFPDLNVLPNPGFEVDTAGWIGILGSVLTRVTTQFKVGVASCEVDTVGAAAGEGIQSTPATAAAVGDTWYGVAWVKAPLNADMRVRITDGVGSTTQTFIATGEWQRVGITRVLTGVTVSLIVSTNGAVQDILFYVDGMSMEKTAVLLPKRLCTSDAAQSIGGVDVSALVFCPIHARMRLGDLSGTVVPIP
jgi:hypothetical protein